MHPSRYKIINDYLQTFEDNNIIVMDMLLLTDATEEVATSTVKMYFNTDITTHSKYLQFTETTEVIDDETLSYCFDVYIMNDRELEDYEEEDILIHKLFDELSIKHGLTDEIINPNNLN